MKDLLKEVQLIDLRGNNLLEVDWVSKLILNLVLNAWEYILHVHYSMV